MIAMRFFLAVGLACGCGGATAPTPAPTPTPRAAPAMCTGQLATTSSTAHTGAMPLQLSPGFLDRMRACGADERTVPPALVLADAGVVNEKGDCAWPSGVSCHYHLGVEFVASGIATRPHYAEIHCIFPVDEDPKSPHVFGGHFACRAGTRLPVDRHASVGAACGAGLLPAVAALAASPACDARCCDDGTLTVPTAEREKASTLDVRPDFRICSAPTELDCDALTTLSGHPANAPIYGAPVAEPL